MNKVAHYLQQHLTGEVLVSPEVLRYFSTDESIFQIKPMLVVHPRNENDMRKTARFSWQLAERGRVVPLTPRGKGTDRSGGAIGSGVIVSTTAHMNKVIELDPKSGIMTAEVGAIVGKLQQTLFTHGRFLPTGTASYEYTTLGGAVANNDSGPDAYKYGPIREFVRGLRVVLANGELIKTYRLSKRELNKKLGLASFEGEIYRSLDKLIEESTDLIEQIKNLGDRNNVGYALADVKLKDGSFDLTPLLVGSQGTLGLMSEVTLDTVPHSPQKTSIVAVFTSRSQAWTATGRINTIKDGPMTLDFVDRTLIDFVQSTNPNLYNTTLESSHPDTVLFIEIEKDNARNAKKVQKKVLKMIKEAGGEGFELTNENRDDWYVLRDSASQLVTQALGNVKPLPIINDAVVPVESAAEFITKAETLLSQYGQVSVGFWGQAGSGIIQAAPMFDIGQIGDRQKMFRLIDQYYKLVVDAGGSIAGQTAEGRMQGTQVGKYLTPELIDLMRKVKTIFDPFGTMNPGVKVDVDIEELKTMLRSEYSLDHQHSHLPR